MPRKLAPDGSKNLIGTRIRELRRANNLSQEQLSNHLQILGFDCERGVIKRIENKTRFVSDIELHILCTYFNVSPNYLLSGEP